MGLRKYIKDVFVNTNVIPYQFKTRTLQMVLGCWNLGRYPISLFPRFVQIFEGSVEMLAPIILVTVFVSIPFTFFILGMSQYSKKGWIQLWQASPAWTGIGIVGMLCLYLSSLYNASLCADFLYYTIRCLETQIPWLDCGVQHFETDGCYTLINNRSLRLDCIDMHDEEHCSEIDWKNSAQYFFDNTVKFKKEDDGFHFNNELIPYQAGVTVLLYICIRNSTASVALFSPFLLIVPTLLHGILLVRSLIHPGALRALETMCSFNFSNFLDIEFWFEVGVVSVYSTGFAYGGLSNLGMQYSFRHPVNVDAVFINLASITYAIMYTVFIFNTFGILSYELNISMGRLIHIETDANFIQCPMSFTHLSFVKFWTFIFFLSNFLVMFRTLVMQCEMFLCMFYELKPILRSYVIPCALTFCFTHLFWCVITNFQLFHELLIQLEEIISYNIFPALAFYFYIFIALFYGVSHFVDDMHFMLGFRPSNLWKLNGYFGLLINLALLIYSLYIFEPECDIEIYYTVLIIMIILCLIPLIYFLIFVMVKCHKKVVWTDIFKATKDWGPGDEILRKSRDMFSAHDMTKEYLYRQKRLKFKTTDTSLSKTNASLNVNM